MNSFTLTNVLIHPCTVPSGHILTEPELQVLSRLLAAYSSEKIKEIQQAIQKRQGRGVSRQEVERSLREVGMMTIADELEQNLQKGTLYHSNKFLVYCSHHQNSFFSIAYIIFFTATKVYIYDVLTCRAWKRDSVAKKRQLSS